jgi:hypothetical protein
MENAPWLSAEDSWETVEAHAAELRPGWWCHAVDQMRFVRVSAVTLLPSQRGRAVFVDLDDGRTLALDEQSVIWVRRERQ